MNKKAKHLFFDLDDTVTMTRSEIDPDGYELFKTLAHNIVVISGAQLSQMSKQLLDLPVYRLGQNGNQALHKHGHMLWEEQLTPEQEQAVRDHIKKIQLYCTHTVKNPDDLVEHRGSQISYSLVGHNEDTHVKKSFDPTRILRQSLLEKVPLDSEHIEVKIGGTTCYDYFARGKHKGFNIERLIAHEGWNKEDCLYFGDALVPGGNDEAVIGVIETVSVENHRHTYEILREHFLN